MSDAIQCYLLLTKSRKFIFNSKTSSKFFQNVKITFFLLLLSCCCIHSLNCKQNENPKYIKLLATFFFRSFVRSVPVDILRLVGFHHEYAKSSTKAQFCCTTVVNILFKKKISHKYKLLTHNDSQMCSNWTVEQFFNSYIF